MALTPSLPLPVLRPKTLLRISVAVAILTIVLKGTAGWITHSMGLISDAMEAFVNLASALFALGMVTIAERPPDRTHPFGHHKAEYFSAGFEGLLIVAAALAIAWTAVGRLVAPEPLEHLGWGMALSLLSSAFNAVLALMMFKSARVHRSIALEADGRHLMADVWRSVGVVAGLGAVMLTGWMWLDPLLALLVAANIVREGVHLVWRSVNGLMDRALPSPHQMAIRDVLDRFIAEQAAPGELRFDSIATRRSGKRRFAELHMHLPDAWSLRQAALLRDRVEQALMDAVPGLRVSIQLLPLTMESRAAQLDAELPPP